MWLLYGQSVHLPTQRPLSLNHDGKPKLIKEEKRKKKLFFNQIIPNFATMMNDFTPWTLFVDAGIVAVLLLIGKWIRVTVKPVQRLFIPPSLIAGFLGLAFGPNGLGWIPLSTHVGTYAGILIAFIFGCLPFSSKGLGDDRANIGRIWFYSQSGMLMQWIFGGFVGLTLLHYGWPRLNEAFGLAMPSGFCGGHGTAAAIGSAFHTLGYDDMLTLAMTSATVGIIAAVVCGLFIVKWATRRGHTAFLSDFAQLPPELRVGLLSVAKRTSMGTSTCSSISIDSLTFNLIIVMAVALGGYGLSQGVTLLLPTLQLPVFSCAFVVGIGVVTLFKKSGVTPYVCPQTIGHLSGTFTDLLVACGIAAIKLSVVVQYLVPLSLLLLSGLVVTLLYVFLVARRVMPDYWFEKAIFTWGWYTGTMAMGIALLRVVDPEMRSRCLDEYAVAYLFIAPVEISLVTFAPVAFVSGNGWSFIAVCLLVQAVILAVAHWKRWDRK